MLPPPPQVSLVEMAQKKKAVGAVLSDAEKVNVHRLFPECSFNVP
jgi:hypothetical protein